MLLVVAAASILLGTLYPLVVDALDLGKISVGPPYFNSVFIPLTAPLAMLVGIGALARWKRDTLRRTCGRGCGSPFVLALVLGVAYPMLLTPTFVWQAAFGMVLADLGRRHRPWWRYASASDRHQNWRHIPRGFWGMVLGHPASPCSSSASP